MENGAAYIGYGSNAISAITGYTDRRGNQIPGCLLSTGSLVRETVSSESMDALAYVTYPTQSLITASYVSEGDELLYGYGAGYFSAIPEGAQVLIRLDGAREPLEGFLVGGGEHYDDFLDNSIQAISYQKDGLNLALFANTLTNKLHQRDEFNFISNMAFSSLLGGVYAGSVKTAGDAKALGRRQIHRRGRRRLVRRGRGAGHRPGPVYRHLRHHFCPCRYHHPRHAGHRAPPSGRPAGGGSRLFYRRSRGLLLRRCGGLGRRARRDLRHLRRRLLPQRRPDP